jgi:hypothetical protein
MSCSLNLEFILKLAPPHPVVFLVSSVPSDRDAVGVRWCSRVLNVSLSVGWLMAIECNDLAVEFDWNTESGKM